MLADKIIRKLSFLCPLLAARIGFLDKKKIKKLMQGKPYLVAALANRGFLELALNWAESLKKLGIKNYAVFTPDKSVQGILEKKGVNACLVNSKIPGNAQKFGTLRFNNIVLLKPVITYRLLKTGINVLFSDVDIAWLSNPLDYIKKIDSKKNGDYDIHVQCDLPDEFSIRDIKDPCERCNSGFYYAKSSKKAAEFFRNALKKAWQVPNDCDQYYFNSAVKKMKGKIRINVLDPLLFPNGSIYFKNHKKYLKFGKKPVIVHANWAVGINKKTELLKKSGFWNL